MTGPIHIESEVNRLSGLEDDALDLIDELMEERKREQEKKSKTVSKTSGGKKTVATYVVPKAREKVNPMTILADKTILETQEDIDQYLGALRSSMEKIINDGKRIQITDK